MQESTFRSSSSRTEFRDGQWSVARLALASLLLSSLLVTVAGCTSAPAGRGETIGTAIGPADVAAMAAGTWQLRSEKQQGMAVLGGLLAYDMTTTHQVAGIDVSRERISAGPLWIAGTTESRALTDAGEESHGNWFFPFWRYREVDGERTLYPLMVIPIPLGNSGPSDLADLDPIAPWEPTAVDTHPAAVPPEPVQIGSSADYPLVDPLERTYRLRQGDTLWSLSSRFYGTGQRWRDIVTANPAIIDDIHNMAIGTSIVIPR